MNITRFEPWSLLNAMHHDLGRYPGRRQPSAAGNSADTGTAESAADWVPAVDIVEEKDRFVLRADVPGVQPEDIDINMENGALTVAGLRNDACSDEADGMRRVERINGRFSRRFSLPDTANADEISARSKDGILEVVIPKMPEIKARRITVEAA